MNAKIFLLWIFFITLWTQSILLAVYVYCDMIKAWRHFSSLSKEKAEQTKTDLTCHGKIYSYNLQEWGTSLNQ